MDSPQKSTESTMGDVSTQPEIDSFEEDLEEDPHSKEEKDLLEDDIRKMHKMDTVSSISSLRLTTSDLSRMRIPLCRLVPMPMVRPTLSCDLILLEQQLVNGYEEGVFFISI